MAFQFFKTPSDEIGGNTNKFEFLTFYNEMR